MNPLIDNNKYVVDTEFFKLLILMEDVIHGTMLNPSDMDINLDKWKRLRRDYAPLFTMISRLDFCVSTFIMRNSSDLATKESDVHKLFREKYKKIIGSEYTIINRKNKRKHIPDFWVTSSDNEVIPVEIKLGKVTVSNGLEQIQRYMKEYNCAKGIIIGRKLKCSLPNNIMFFAHPL